MIKTTLRFGVLLAAVLALATTLQGQVFWSEDFSGGGVPAGWTNVDGSGRGSFLNGAMTRKTMEATPPLPGLTTLSIYKAPLPVLPLPTDS